jgi:integrative and conjugative element protein (TIGR02256 family)
VNHLALEQIGQLSTRDGAIQLRAVEEQDGQTRLKVSLDTRGIRHAPGGIRIRQREVFWFIVPADFPFSPPAVEASHQRWAGTAHVQWGSHVCIYAAPSVEWVPADGLRGLIDRLLLWLERAAMGTLDPEGQPLHPPVAYATRAAGELVVRADLGDRVPWRTGPTSADLQYAWCVLDGDRSDVVGWLTYDEVVERVLAEDFDPVDPRGRPIFIAAAAFISDQIGFEYPRTAKALLDALTRSGLPADNLLDGLSRARLVNSVLENLLDKKVALPNLVLLATPSRRVEHDLLAHVSAWRLNEIGNDLADLLRHADWGVLKDREHQIHELAAEWLRLANTSWMRVWEDRREVTRPRDTGSTTASLRGRSVLIVGCGALGAHIAEFCVRAGVTALTVADRAAVGPGILTRQPYRDADIGKAKAQLLAQRLSGIRTDLTVVPVVGDAKATVLSSGPLSQGHDLVIDATADVGVRTAIEARRSADRENWPDLLCVMIGHDAKRGVVTASASSASGGPADVLRRFSLTCLATPSLADIAADFFPAEARGDLFFPEPGCSSPTFTGSHADVTGLAAMLLNEGLALLDVKGDQPMAAAAVRRESRSSPAVQTEAWSSDVVTHDTNGGGYEIRISSNALNEMRAEARRGLRVRGPQVETGGMLLGAIDDACQVINIDRVTGPPPDSLLSQRFFQHGVAGTQAVVDERRFATGNRQSFVGLWHTHPYGRAAPSETDDEGMWELVTLHGVGRRALMVIVGGSDWEQWLQAGTIPSIYARVSVLGAAHASARTMRQQLADPSAFAGGFSYPASFHASPGESDS